MKKIILIVCFVSIYLIGNSQFSSDLVVYNPYGDVFSLYLGNSIVNNYPANKIRVNDLQEGNYILNISFRNQNIPSINQSVYIPKNAEVACAISRDNNGAYFLSSYSPIVYTDINNYNPPDNINPVPNPSPGGIYCDFPMDDNSFALALASIKKKSFDSDKLIIAKQITNSNCLLSSQVKKIVKLFSFENNKLKFAKYAYKHTFDPNNYYKINDAFDFSSSIKKLNSYISSVHQ